MDNTWGGSRPGSGRKQLSDIEKKKGYTFQLIPADLDYILTMDGKNKSECLKILIEEHKNLKKQIDFSRNTWYTFI